MKMEKRLKKLKIEDYIWIIYFFIAAFALLSNHYERDFILNKNFSAYKKEKTINVTIFFVALFIYLYFVLNFMDDLEDIEHNLNNPKYRNKLLQLIAAILFLVGGIIYLYLEITTDEMGDIAI